MLAHLTVFHLVLATSGEPAGARGPAAAILTWVPCASRDGNATSPSQVLCLDTFVCCSTSCRASSTTQSRRNKRGKMSPSSLPWPCCAWSQTGGLTVAWCWRSCSMLRAPWIQWYCWCALLHSGRDSLHSARRQACMYATRGYLQSCALCDGWQCVLTCNETAGGRRRLWLPPQLHLGGQRGQEGGNRVQGRGEKA